MKVTLEFPDNKAAFMLELLSNLPFVKAKTVKPKGAALDTTESLLQHPANRERLLASVAEIERGLAQPHDLIEP